MKCSKCKKEKLIGDFHKDSRSLNGRHSICKECRNISRKQINRKGKKLCSKCGKWKLLIDFNLNSYKKDFRQSYCAVCALGCQKNTKSKLTKKQINIIENKISAINSRISMHNKIVERDGFNPYYYNITPEEMKSLQERLEKLQDELK